MRLQLTNLVNVFQEVVSDLKAPSKVDLLKSKVFRPYEDSDWGDSSKMRYEEYARLHGLSFKTFIRSCVNAMIKWQSQGLADEQLLDSLILVLKSSRKQKRLSYEDAVSIVGALMYLIKRKRVN